MGSRQTRCSNIKFGALEELKAEVTKFLIENHAIWEELGPQSDASVSDPGSNAFVLWDVRKMDTVIPNNQKIINMIESNMYLLDSVLYREFLLFKSHAMSFEANQYARLDAYPLFPTTFPEAFSE